MIWFSGVVIVLAVAITSALFYRDISKSDTSQDLQPSLSSSRKTTAVNVEIIKPRLGGIQRVCVQPGTLEPFESADLYAKVSGFLAEQSVDIGSQVKKGQLLARISVPEFETQLQRCKADVTHAVARIQQSEAHLTAVKAEARAAKAMILLAEAQLKSKSAYRKFREKQLSRYRELMNQQAIDAKVVDEEEDHYESAVSAEIAAKETVNSSKLQAEAAEARIAQTQADLEESKATKLIAEADVAKAQVMLDYTRITSPYDGVITRRLFYPGAFIRSAESSSEKIPIVSVERTDLFRTIIQVPDRDVPYVSPGNEARIEIDALPGRVITGKIARLADSEDTATRTMRVEVDIPNPDGKLRRGMYGRTTLILNQGVHKSLTIPSAALLGKAENGKAKVRTVKEGRIHLTDIKIGVDNGVDVEVLSGLSIEDAVVIKSNGTLEEGTTVTASNVESKKDSH
ncbi:efflux RND transporter periplasmic adaptor subunit [Telmatocola sphagniphila]|uniref:Efflux RND transporter periplasmic adaptor subunit n=1 Tax=Telmatocola sphagniphila TaxID=1123043 RepID=A0A8E6B7L7_9BACT|nr:efflux RND transporter periplasmic adaptor subunit [Telmatocola sphagniphila]QVL33600.1 efflux RND transporter periplasmic adaptor subunit [Telmatocola sphagniphila]